MPPPDPPQSEVTTARRAVGQGLRDLRISREWSQATLAEQVGLSISSISAYELATRAISLEHLASLCAAFDLLVTEFLDDVYPYGTRIPPRS